MFVALHPGLTEGQQGRSAVRTHLVISESPVDGLHGVAKPSLAGPHFDRRNDEVTAFASLTPNRCHTAIGGNRVWPSPAVHSGPWVVDAQRKAIMTAKSGSWQPAPDVGQVANLPQIPDV